MIPANSETGRPVAVLAAFQVPAFPVLERCQRIKSGLLGSEYRPESQIGSSGDLTPAQTLQPETQHFYCIDVLARAAHFGFTQLLEFRGGAAD